LREHGIAGETIERLASEFDADLIVDTLERLADMARPVRGWQSFLDGLASLTPSIARDVSPLARLLLPICTKASGCIVREDFQFSRLELAIDEAEHLVAEADSSAGSPEARKCGLQATTLVVTAVAGALDRSRRAQLLVIAVCDNVLALDEIRLRVEWPPNGRDRLYKLAVESADLHDDSVYAFLDRYCCTLV
jgi:hypothetical protein